MDEKLSITYFNSAIRVEIPWLDSEQLRLGVTPAKATYLVTKLGDEVTPGTWMYYFVEYLDETKQTDLTIASLETLREEIYRGLLDAYGDIAANKWTDQDRIKLGRKTGTRAPRTKPGAIDSHCNATFTPLGGGKLKVACRTTPDESRPSKALNSDGVKVYYEIVTIPRTEDGHPELGGITKLQGYLNALKCSNQKFFSKASFTLELGSENSGLSLMYHIQWVNSKYPGKVGPMAGPFIITIL